KECDFGFYLSVLKTLKTNHFGFNKFSALMETAEAIGKDLKQKGIKKINLTFLFTNSPIKGMDKFMETLPQKSRVDISKFELNNQVFYLLIDDFARSGSKSVYKTFEKFIGDDLISVSYYRHESFKEALNKCFNNSSLNVKGYPMSMYFERYKILYNNQTAFTQYAYSESIDGRYWKGWLTKNGFKSLGCELVNCEELVLVNGFNVPVKESRRLTIRKGQGTYTLYFDKDIDGGKFSEPKLLLAEVGSVHQYMIGTENIKNHLKK
ncbi:MAG: hypothetical protein AB8G11_04000, partial [Saprospiraceae bacterium]